MIRTVFLIVFGLALLSLGMSIILSRPAEAQEPVSIVPACIPYELAIALILQSGGRIMGEISVPFAKNGRLLVFESEGSVFASGIAGDHLCVYSPSTAVGPVVPGTPA